jgi:threonine/homoserine/homoserine lactone efflux protein
MMLLASGANFGFRRTVPHMLGIGIGHSVMVFLVGLGLAGAFLAVPWLYTVMKVASVAYMLWLAWKIAQAAPPEGGQAGGRPFTFFQAAAFQWVNPKAWAMALGATTVYAPDRTVPTMLVVAVVFAAVNLPSVSLWTVAGEQLRRFLTKPARLRAFNWAMAGLLVVSLVPMLFD